jgi:hypothetical protein
MIEGIEVVLYAVWLNKKFSNRAKHSLRQMVLTFRKPDGCE